MKKSERIYIFICQIILFIGLIGLFSGCKSKTLYVPVESVKTEYRDRLIKDTASRQDIRNVKDSVVIKDSVVYILNEKGEIVSKEVYKWRDKYYYSEHFLKELQSKYDSLLSLKQNTIRVPYPVKGDTIEVNKLKWYQEACIWFTSLVLVALALYLGIKHRGKIFSLFRKLIFKV